MIVSSSSHPCWQRPLIDHKPPQEAKKRKTTARTLLLATSEGPGKAPRWSIHGESSDHPGRMFAVEGYFESPADAFGSAKRFLWALLDGNLTAKVRRF